MSDLKGRSFAVAGVANDRSICWAVSHQIQSEGGEVFHFCHPRMIERVSKLTDGHGMPMPIICDVEQKDGEHSIGWAMNELVMRHGSVTLHGLVHGIAFSDSAQLAGRFIDTTRENFARTMLISSFSLVEMAKACAPMMSSGGSIVTLSFDASERTYPNYNVMGLAKAALECAVRYLAVDLGREGIRVNAVSPSPENTLSARGISNFLAIGAFAAAKAPDGKRATLEEIAFEVVKLLDSRSGVNGQTLRVDHGASIVEMPAPWNAKPMSDAMLEVDKIFKKENGG